MQQLISFFYRNKNFLFFIFLEGLAFFFTVQSHSFHSSKFVNTANAVTGGIYKKVNSFSEFLHLREENEILAQENVYLKNLLGKEMDLNKDNFISLAEFKEIYKKHSKEHTREEKK